MAPSGTGGTFQSSDSLAGACERPLLCFQAILLEAMAEIWRSPFNYVKAPMPVMARPTMSVCMVSVPSKVWIASRSAMCRATW